MSDLGLCFFNRKNATAETEQLYSSSASSTVAGDDNNSTSSGDTNAFITFGILRNDEENDHSRTRQLFPAAGVREAEYFADTRIAPAGPLGSSGEGGGKKQWLNLSCRGESSEPPVPATVSERNTKQGPKKSRRGPKSRSSQYRGVTFYRRTGRWESHIWDCGKQIYLGGFDTSYAAARAYDRAALRFRGLDADINFQVSDYKEDVNKLKNLSKEEVVQILRRESNGFGRGSSRYKGLNLSLHNCCNVESQIPHYNKWDVTTIKCNDPENERNLELSLGVSSSENTKMKQQVYLTMAGKNPNFLTTPSAASSGFSHYINTHEFASSYPMSRFNT